MTAAESVSTTRLVEQARDRNASLQEQHAAFTILVERGQHAVFGLALTRLRDAEEARDVAQDAFATAWRRLRQLRDPAAFGPWLNSITVSECSRRQRRRGVTPEADASARAVEPDVHRMDYQSVVADAVASLPAGERTVLTLFYYLGHSQPEIARLLRLKAGTVGKRLHSARLRLRRALPRSVRGDFVPIGPSEAFADRVRRGLLDDYIGQYRFERRPDHVVSIVREGSALISEASGQRHVLVSAADRSLLTIHYDGEGRFHRDRRGQVTHFVYYEFGRRMGIARRIDAAE